MGVFEKWLCPTRTMDDIMSIASALSALISDSEANLPLESRMTNLVRVAASTAPV